MTFIFHHIWDVILPIDELIFFKMVIAPPTSYGFLMLQIFSYSNPVRGVPDFFSGSVHSKAL